MENSVNSIKAPALVLLATILVWGQSSALADNPPSAVAAKSPATASADKTQTTNLGKIDVAAMKEMVETLQQVKIALKTPFDDNPKHLDEMVCRLDVGHRAVAYLGCGTQGWYSRRHELTQLSLLCQCASNVPDRGHPWHSMRTLNFVQLMQLRALLKELPPTSEGDVVVVDAESKVLTTIHSNATPGTGDKIN